MGAITSQLFLIFGRMHRKFDLRLLQLILIVSSGIGSSYAQPLSGILPKNQSNLNNFNVSFEWNSAPNAVNYQIQFASNNTFSSNYTQSPLTNLTTWSSFVPSQGTYYWRVKAFTANDSSCSPTYTFTYLPLTAIIIVVPLAFVKIEGVSALFNYAPDTFFNLVNGEYTWGFILAFALYNLFFLGGNWAYVQ